MHFGIFLEESRRGTSQATALHETIELAEAAEVWGLDGVWLGEIHFNPARSVLAAPIAVASFIAARTRRLRVGTAVQVLPLGNPLRIAEEVATIDHLSQGRFDFGIGRSGAARTYDVLGIAYEESQARFLEALAVIRKAWKGLQIEFVGADPMVRPVGRDAARAVASYFKGDPTRWRTGLPTFESIVYEELWPGIDLVYTGAVGRVKYAFLVKPGTDPRRIRLAYRGATGLRLTPAGQLRIETPIRDIVDEAPEAYQEVAGRRLPVRLAYALESGAGAGSDTVSFSLGHYDVTRPLIVDPVVLVYAATSKSS